MPRIAKPHLPSARSAHHRCRWHREALRASHRIKSVSFAFRTKCAPPLPTASRGLASKPSDKVCLLCLPHEVRTTVAGGTARLCEQATGDRLSLPSRPAEGGPDATTLVRPQPGGKQEMRAIALRWLASPKRLAALPATVVRPKRAKNCTTSFMTENAHE
jgi:hypothetical protein